jgi:uncharacterized protein (DUF58 family)
MTTSLHVVLGLFALSLLALAVTGWPIYSRLSYLWGFLLVGSRLWAALALRGVQVQRKARIRRAQVGQTFQKRPEIQNDSRAQVGQIFQERFEIQNDSRLPRLWLEVRDQSTLPGSQGSRVLSMIRGQQRRSYRARTRLVQRGVFPLGPTVLASGDPFGLFPVSRIMPPAVSLLVYPITVEVRAFPNPPGLLPGGEALRCRTHQVTPNVAGVRDYAPGDSLNRIHWVSTARRERLMVKEFELDPLAEVWVFLDVAREVQSALPYSPPDLAVDALLRPLEEVVLPPSTEEYAVSIAASLGRYFLQRGRAVGLVSCGQSQSPSVLPPDRGGRQLGKVLEAMALLRAAGDLPISALVAARARHLPRGSTVILITPSVQEEVALTVDHLLRRGLRPVVVLLDAASFGGPPGTEALTTAITALGAPVCQITNGADLGTVLSEVAADLVVRWGQR